ncbi:helix-turn-helix transcriptional regulator [Kitasatospora sp. NPDC093806]|uniref:helix-turn-helix domain-containing protein n=1 Tax=Kitasatospora sp. NPDC093806 TaxID=3155075 RepID=UPI003413C1CE
MVFAPNELDPDKSARDQFGWEMREHRKRAGTMPLERLAEIVKISKGHLGRIERAESMPPPDLPAKLDAAFNTDGRFGRIYSLARKEKFPGRYRRAIELEADSSIIEEYACANVPGLLQTPAFARCSLRAGHPHATQQEIDELVAARLGRQARLGSASPPRCWYVLDEAVLRRPVGTDRVMRYQLMSLATERRSFITIQVLPFSAGAHQEMGGSLTLYTLPDGATTAWAEGARDGVVIDEPDRVATRREAYDYLKALALSPRHSQAMIRSILKEYSRAGHVAKEHL